MGWHIPPEDGVIWAINLLMRRFRSLDYEDRLDVLELLGVLHMETKANLSSPTEEAVAAIAAIREILENAPCGLQKL